MSSIQWCEETWNPTTGCDRISPGCENCYAAQLAARLKGMGQRKYQNDGDPLTSGPGFALTTHADTLDKPRHWRKPRVIFVNSMSDLFHEKVPFSFIEQVSDVMVDTPRHTYQILTKRSPRLAKIAGRLPWPDNVWMGVSIETDQYTYRARHLAATPAAVKFLSCEPLLEPLPSLPLKGIDWVILGGESGPKARPLDLDWMRDIQQRCVAEGVKVFVKQLGTDWSVTHGHGRKKGGDPKQWPQDLRMREMP